ncbi:MAG: RNA-directed DNA polymerase [Acidobacteria bacterium]|nr:RNA-directed DNA polymerase [Acidobacteriota bacterium]
MQKLFLVKVIAGAFLSGEPTIPEIVARLSRTLGKRWDWIHPLAQRYIKTIAGRTRPRRRDVVKFLLQDSGFKKAWSNHAHQLSIKQWLTEPQRMQPVSAAENWGIPVIESIGALAQWLELTPSELLWFSDLRGLGCRSDERRLRHYHYRILDKQYGNIRLIELPKPRLKQLQLQILAQILERIPPHPSVHGFVKRRSIKTFVAPHVGRPIVLRMDLREFFPSFRAARIQTLFRTIGYPEPVADLLGGICTNAVSRDVWKKPSPDVHPCRWSEARILYSKPHLPQGAPTSPALANLCGYRMDCRLAGLAKSVGAQYTRYADDLAFSGDKALEMRIERFATHVAAILIEEGFMVHYRKTRVMRQGVRQHLVGLVINHHVNTIRPDFDRLKATLTNCVRLGPESQNRNAHPHLRLHLEGRLGFVEMINPSKGKRLRAIFNQINWQ